MLAEFGRRLANVQMLDGIEHLLRLVATAERGSVVSDLPHPLRP